ncbi:16303_t:CDS:1, partial [Funneliformis geosporum]
WGRSELKKLRTRKADGYTSNNENLSPRVQAPNSPSLFSFLQCFTTSKLSGSSTSTIFPD